jgi:NitT/TauT family transport system substrate-binding protein
MTPVIRVSHASLAQMGMTLSRRHFVRALGSGALGVLAAACAPAAPPSSATSAPAAQLPATAAAPAKPAAAAPPTTAASPVPSPATAASPSAAASPSTVSSSVGIAGVRPLAPRATLKLAFNPNIIQLPFQVAIDKGYFDTAGLDVQVTNNQGSSNAMLPLLARGDIDATNMTPSPALYSQAQQGFDIRVVASHGVEKQGRITIAWLAVLKDRAAEIKEFADLKGRTVEGGAPGTVFDLLALQAVQQANLVPGQDVNVTYRVRNTADTLTLAQNKAADVIAMVDPMATQAEQQGLIVRWKTTGEVVPWYQPSLLAMSSKFLTDNRPAAVKFMEVYLVAAREVNATNGQWTPDLLATAARWNNLEPSIITAQGGVVSFEPNAFLDPASLDRSQQFWVQTNQLKQSVDLSQVMDVTPTQDALATLGKL